MMDFTDLVKDVLFENGPKILMIKGNSMYPTLLENSEVEIQPLKKLSPGDCCVYLKGGNLVIHRLLFKNNYWAYIAGDNSTKIEKIAIENIIGIAKLDEHQPRKIAILIINYLFLPFNKTVLFKFRIRIFNYILRKRYNYEAL